MGTNPTNTLEGVCDSIVSNKTLKCYMGEIMKFLLWCVENKPNWLTADGTDHIALILEEHGGEGVHAWRSHTCTEFFGLLHSCYESPVLLLDEVTPHEIMEYAMGHCHIWGWPWTFIQVSLRHYSCSGFPFVSHPQSCQVFRDFS